MKFDLFCCFYCLPFSGTLMLAEYSLSIKPEHKRVEHEHHQNHRAPSEHVLGPIPSITFVHKLIISTLISKIGHFILLWPGTFRIPMMSVFYFRSDSISYKARYSITSFQIQTSRSTFRICYRVWELKLALKKIRHYIYMCCVFRQT